jgi:octaprenyl-diphosphate synthase
LIADTIRSTSEDDRNAPVDPDTLAQIISVIKKTGAIAYTYKKAEDHVNQAKVALSLLSESPYKSELINLADFSLGRDY